MTVIAPNLPRGEPFESEPGEALEHPGRSSFLKVGDRVFHTCSIYARGLETIDGSYYMLDETALGRQEDWKSRRAAPTPSAPPFPISPPEPAPYR